MPLPTTASPPRAAVTLLDRDHSILAFNERVLDWAHRPDVPLLERLRYLCIVSSNLDEFFEVRAAPHLIAAQGQDDKGCTTSASFQAMAAATHALVAQQYALYNDDLLPTFARNGIKILSHGERNAAQRRWVREYFEREVRPLLIPVSLDPAHPFPQVANKSLNFIVKLGGQRCLRARERDRHRQGAAGTAPFDTAASQGVGQTHGAGVAVQRDPRPPGGFVPWPRSRPVLAVPRHPPLRSGGGRRRRAKPAHRAARRPGHAPLRPGGAAGGVGGAAHSAGSAIAGGPSPKSSEQRSLGGAGFYQVYKTSDGRHVVLGGREIKFATNLLTALGRPDLIALAEQDAGPVQAPLIAFLREAGTAEKADIARHFGLKGHERRMLQRGGTPGQGGDGGGGAESTL